MKIHRDCDEIIGTVLRQMLIDFIKRMKPQMRATNWQPTMPPIGEWYAEKATRYKAIDKEIADHMRQVIKESPK